MIDFSKYVKSKKEIKYCLDIPYFCGISIECFSFLIDDFDFEKAEIELLGREMQISFKKRNNHIFKIAYEMGSLPEFFIIKNGQFINLKELNKEYQDLSNSGKYVIHKKIQEIINSSNSGVNNYIKEISSFWDDNKEEIKSEIKTFIYDVSILIKNNMDLVDAKSQNRKRRGWLVF